MAKAPLAGRRPASATRAGPRTARRPPRNAHPHATDKVAIVHNGIIENFRALREELMKAGHKFASETDSEVIAHLITPSIWTRANRREQAAIAAVRRLEGAFAIACLFAGQDDLLIGARKGSPLVVGLGDGENVPGLATRSRSSPVHARA